MSAYPTCEQLGLAANAAAHQVIKIYNQRDIEYDRVTRHGRTQGARFP
jgi:predicted secreted Zn-dependent protease